MIHKNYKDGETLDVAGLNQITVLIDRSETEKTEIGWNNWSPDLDGPPHKHNDKDQVFYITDGRGKVRVEDEIFDVQPGNLVYVPAGNVHQTITSQGEPLCYMLFNIFNNPEKEGHATFADHIEKVKEIRKEQAEKGIAEVIDEEVLPNRKKAKFFKSPSDGKYYDFFSNSTILLLERNETNDTELALIGWPNGSKGAMVAHKDKEQTFFVLEGTGIVTIGDEEEELKPGDVAFVPRNTKHTTESTSKELVYLCMNALINAGDESFDSMYQRVASGRKKRWEAGDTSVGE